jgi:transposase
MDRMRAAVLFEAGATRAAVARALGVCRATASRWYRLWRAGALADAPRRAGRRPKLAIAQWARLERTIARPPAEAGFALGRWSLAAIAALIERETGTRYHRRHLGRLLRRRGWIVPPVGPHAAAALRTRPMRDPDGNAARLLERVGG